MMSYDEKIMTVVDNFYKEMKSKKFCDVDDILSNICVFVELANPVQRKKIDILTAHLNYDAKKEVVKDLLENMYFYLGIKSPDDIDRLKEIHFVENVIDTFVWIDKTVNTVDFYVANSDLKSNSKEMLLSELGHLPLRCHPIVSVEEKINTLKNQFYIKSCVINSDISKKEIHDKSNQPYFKIKFRFKDNTGKATIQFISPLQEEHRCKRVTSNINVTIDHSGAIYTEVIKKLIMLHFIKIMRPYMETENDKYVYTAYYDIIRDNRNRIK